MPLREYVHPAVWLSVRPLPHVHPTAPAARIGPSPVAKCMQVIQVCEHARRKASTASAKCVQITAWREHALAGARPRGCLAARPPVYTTIRPLRPPVTDTQQNINNSSMQHNTSAARIFEDLIDHVPVVID